MPCIILSVLIATWNVNSIRARITHVSDWLARVQPDILLMQELKGLEFPKDTFRALGYESASITQKTYNGVAILSKSPIETISTTLRGDKSDSHARYLETRIGNLRVVNVYVPNGNPPHSDNFRYKLGWTDRLIEQMREWLNDPTPTVVAGDMNVIPEDIDCHKPTSWAHDALFQPETRERYRSLLAMGWTDAFRTCHPGEGGHFTYWDYFRNAFAGNRGIRIDHFLLSPSLAPRLKTCRIDADPRRLEKPSDHAPILLTLQ
jgi:exodeoxyribonuclease III